MKKLILFTAIMLIAVACKKTKFAPLGPTDIRINNIESVIMNDLTVNTSGGEYIYGTLNATSISDYHRFEKAYPKAQITATIGGEVYTTGPVDYTYLQYLSTVKATYKIRIKDAALKKLEIFDVIIESPLK
ncbi:MAG: hypothetical protein C0408_01260 [Odoribacter sp.]|nr:hypothetical protein [Odoribacter sp.]